jgi:hypothetical protein
MSMILSSTGFEQSRMKVCDLTLALGPAGFRVMATIVASSRSSLLHMHRRQRTVNQSLFTGACLSASVGQEGSSSTKHVRLSARQRKTHD